MDHHYPGAIPESDRLKTIINEAADTCTSILVNTHLHGAHALWAIVGAFGDNLKNSALALAKGLDLSAGEAQQLENLGTYINYNGYGSSLDDLHFRPDELFLQAAALSEPSDVYSGGQGGLFPAQGWLPE